MKHYKGFFFSIVLAALGFGLIAAGHPAEAMPPAILSVFALAVALPAASVDIRGPVGQFGAIGERSRSTLDANETAFFERQLEFVKSRTYDIKYAELRAVQLIPVSTEAGSGSETITYYTYDQTGLAKLIASYADDLPRSDITGKRNVSNVHSIGNSYGYSVQEIRAAMQAGLPLQQRKAIAARRAHDQQINTIAFFGNAAAGLPGFLNNANVSRSIIANDGAGAATTFVSKTADQIIRDLNLIANAIATLTLDVEQPDTMLLPLAQHSYIMSTPRSTTTDTSIMKWFLANQLFIKNIERVNECKAAGTLGGTLDVCVAYKKDEEHLTLELPQPFEQFPEQPRNLEFIVPCHSRIGGVLIYYPLAVNIGEGI